MIRTKTTPQPIDYRRARKRGGGFQAVPIWGTIWYDSSAKRRAGFLERIIGKKLSTSDVRALAAAQAKRLRRFPFGEGARQ